MTLLARNSGGFHFVLLDAESHTARRARGLEANSV